ncbi:pentatricopeptide repeat-containing protein, putative [Ricinus communis]|uniref:Pentatricopeptide repeat-containing protein, putative n=1 Tax=Ricinus communis TaxID=3988 RepID=B9RTM2_RICCO|nr:pentatricopeptide repeat-containing protein, putative [Ricinus communis]
MDHKDKGSGGKEDIILVRLELHCLVRRVLHDLKLSWLEITRSCRVTLKVDRQLCDGVYHKNGTSVIGSSVLFGGFLCRIGRQIAGAKITNAAQSPKSREGLRPGLKISRLTRTWSLMILKLLSSTTFKHQIVLYHNSVKPFSSTKTTRWNSTTNVIVTHPVLLIMESCTCMIQLKQIQAHMIITGLITHTFPVSRVLAFCALADTGDIRHAHLLFNQIEYPNTYIWNTMIRGFSNAKMPVMGLSFFWQMVRERVEMDTRSFVFALKASEQFLTALEGESIHCAIWKIGFPCALLVQNGLIHFYSVHGCLVLARKVFDETPARDVVSWTSMIDGYSTHDYYTDALKLFDSMLLSDVEPNEVTMISVLSACSQKGDLSLGKSIHEYVRRKNLNLSVNLMNAILDMYVKCGCLVAAREIFDSMGTKDVFSWTSMVNGYAKTGELEIARKFFDDMPKRNVVSWNAMIAGYSQNNQPKKAIVLFHHMVGEGLIPIENTLVCVLSACGQLGYLDLGRLIHMYHIERKQKGTSVIIANALIDMYAKCGVIDAAARVFNGMPGRDLVSWNSMIAACASHGHAKQALLMFGQMIHEGFKPDDITFESQDAKFMKP